MLLGPLDVHFFLATDYLFFDFHVFGFTIFVAKESAHGIVS